MNFDAAAGMRPAANTVNANNADRTRNYKPKNKTQNTTQTLNRANATQPLNYWTKRIGVLPTRLRK